MFVHIGGNIDISDRDLVGIFDMDNASLGKDTRAFLYNMEKTGRCVSAAEDIPKSFVVSAGKDGARVYITQPSAATLARRVKNAADGYQSGKE